MKLLTKQLRRAKRYNPDVFDLLLLRDGRPPKAVRTFFHSGDYGDILYALPTIRALGGGRLLIGPNATYKTRLSQNAQSVESIAPLIRLQPYIEGVEYCERCPSDIDVNLNVFREYLFREQEIMAKGGPRRNLAEAHLNTFGIPDTECDTAWLTVDKVERVPGKPVLIHRSPRWQNPVFPWRKVLDMHGHCCVFVGLASEHEAFVKEFGPIPYQPTANFLELARLIAGCDLYVGNQSAPYAIAEGLKHNAVLEVWPEGPNCLFRRASAITCDTSDVYIPPIRLNREPWFELAKCPVCGSETRSVFFNGLLKCQDCCVVYPEKRMGELREADALQRINPKSHLRPPESVDMIKTSNLRRDYLLQEIVTLKPAPGHLLDVGCSWGALLHSARRYGYTVEGVEINLSGASFARDILGLHVHNSLFSAVDLGEDRYDIILTAHTLDHLGPPSAVLPKLYRALRSGGMFCGIVGNIDSPTAQIMKESWPWLDVSVHWVHFSPSTLRFALEKHGFQLARMYTDIGDYDRNAVANALQTLHPGLSRELLLEKLALLKTTTGAEEIRFFAFKP